MGSSHTTKVEEVLNMSYYWSVVPLCKNQLKDVDPKDILENGLYRLCDTYKSGGGSIEQEAHRF